MGWTVTMKELVWSGFGVADWVFEFSSYVSNTGNVVLMFHSVGEPGRHGNISPDRFREILQHVKREYTVADLPEVLDQDDEKRVAITFDDGWRNFYHHARPVLHELDVPATVFLVSEYIDNEQFLSTHQVENLVSDDLVTVGNHTRTHPYLSRLGNETELRNQIVGAKDRLETMFDTEITRFAYPRGDFTDEAVELVRESHELAVATVPRVVQDRFSEGGVDPCKIPRIKGHHGRRRLRWEMTDLGSQVRELADTAGVITR